MCLRLISLDSHPKKKSISIFFCPYTWTLVSNSSVSIWLVTSSKPPLVLYEKYGSPLMVPIIGYLRSRVLMKIMWSWRVSSPVTFIKTECCIAFTSSHGINSLAVFWRRGVFPSYFLRSIPVIQLPSSPLLLRWIGVIRMIYPWFLISVKKKGLLSN